MNESNATDPSGEETMRDLELTRDLRRLRDQGLEPRRDLWPELRARLEAETELPSPRFDRAESRGSSAWRLAAAAVLVAGLISTTLLWNRGNGEESDWRQLVSRVRTQADLPSELDPATRALLSEHLREREQLLRHISASLESYPPELRSEIRRGIAEVEAAMQDLERSISSAEGDASAQAEQPELVSLYDLELRMLRDVNERLREAGGSTR